MSSVKNIIKTLGPGILFASTAIGVSHLVQSTRAGATYGFALLWAVILANLFKYPFFEYGSRYANAAGESIIDGYHRIGKWMLWLYFFITVGSMFFVCAAVGAVTAGFLDNLFGISASIGANGYMFTTIGLFVICIALLLIGKYNLLDSLIKIIASVLLITTVVAFVLTLAHGPQPKSPNFIPPEILDPQGVGIAFLIALMGWMPTAVDLSAWNSLWTIERIKQTGYKPKLKETLFDFNLGYLVSAVLAICFMTFGAYMIYGTGTVMPDKGHLFANEVVKLYTITIGDWSYIIIAAAAFSIMFSTSITVFDGYARALERTSELLFLKPREAKEALNTRSFYIGSLLLVGIGSFLIIYFFGKSLKFLVDLATTISFLIAPVIAIVNFKLVLGKNVGPDAHPPMWLKVLSILGIVFLTGFSLFYLWTLMS